MRLFSFLIPLWLLGLIVPAAVDSENVSVIQFAVLTWLPVIGIVWGSDRFLVGPIFRERPAITYITVAGLVTLLASAILSAQPLLCLAYVVSAMIGLIACAGLWRVIATRMMHCLAVYAVLGSGIAGLAYLYGPRIQGRLSISTMAHPNFLGLISFGFLICSLAVKNIPLRICLISINFVAIAQAESRSALVASFLGLLTYAAIRITWSHKGKAAFTLAGATLGGIVFLLFFQDAIENRISALLFLNDRYRGLGTGFTGRTELWQEAFDLFLQNPWFGVGFRMHELYIKSAHNGYLSLLAEVGIVGTAALSLLLIALYWSLLRQALRGNYIAAIGFSFVTGYLFLATFERFFLNMGNPTSMLTWLFLLKPVHDGLAPRLRRTQPTLSPLEPLMPVSAPN